MGSIRQNAAPLEELRKKFRPQPDNLNRRYSKESPSELSLKFQFTSNCQNRPPVWTPGVTRAP